MISLPFSELWRHRRRFSWLIVAFLVVFGFLNQMGVSAQESQTPKNILLLHSHEVGLPWATAIDTAIKTTLATQSDIPFATFTEYTGLSYHNTDSYKQQLADLYQVKYRDTHFDVIIAVDLAATAFIETEGATLFPGVPIVFVSSGPNALDFIVSDHMTGIEDHADMATGVATALNLHPNTEAIAVIGGASEVDRLYADALWQTVASYADQYEIIDLTGLTFAETVARVSQLPPRTVIFYSLILTDGAGQTFTPRETIPPLSTAANAPIYSFWDMTLGQGVVGGYLSSTKEIGARLAEMSLRILNGTEPQDIPVVKGAFAYLYDWRQLQQWDIDPDSLPAGSVIEYQELSFWDLYWQRIMAITVLVGVQALLILVLYRSRSQLKQTQQILQEERDNLESVVLERTDELVKANQQLEVEVKERIQAAQVLEESEARYRRLIENAPDIVYRFSSKHGAIFLSPGVELLLGYSVEYLLAHPFLWNQSIHPEDATAVAQAIGEAEGGQSFRVEYRIQDAQGEWHWLYDRSIAYQVQDGETIIEGLATDITDRKQAEEQLRHSETRYRLLAENATDLIYRIRLHPTMAFEYVSPSATTMTGYTPEEHYADPQLGYKLVHPDDRHILTDVVDKNLSEPIVLRWVRKDGRTIWTEQQNVIIYDAAGTAVAIEGIARDITERKQLENDLRQQRDDLDHFFTTTIDLLCIAHNDGRFMRVNKQWEITLGYSVAELEGRNLLDLVHPDDIEATQSALKTLSAANPVLNFVNRYRTKDGRYRFLEWRSYPHGQLVYASARDITDRKQMEDDLRKSEAQKSSILQSMDDLVFILDRQLVYTDFHTTKAQELYFSSDQFLGKKFTDVPFPEPAQTHIHQALLTCLQTGQMQHVTYYLDMDDGRNWFDLKINPLMNGQDSLAGLTCVVRNVTLYKVREVQLADLSQRLQSILTGTNAGTWEWYVQTGETIFNARWAEIIGYTLAELEPISIHTWIDAVHPDDASLSSQLLAQHFRGELDYYECEARMKHKDGSWVWVLDRGRVVSWADDGQPLLMVGTHQEITARKEAEQALQRRTTQLETLRHIGLEMTTQLELNTLLDSVARYAVKLLDGDGGGIHLYDPEKDQLVWAVSLGTDYPLGYTLQRGQGLVGKIWVEQRPLIKNDYADWSEKVNAPGLTAIKAVVGAPIIWGDDFFGVLIVGRAQSHLKFTPDDADLLHLLATQSASAIRNARSFNEITEARQAAEAANQAKSAFLSHMSHELRTPLNSVLGYTQLHKNDANLTERQQLSLQTIERSGQHLLLMINDLLDLSRIEAEKLTLQPTECYLPSFLNTIREMVTVQTQQKGVGFFFRIDPTLPPQVIVDEKQLRQILLNLLGNAVKFTEQGKVSLEVSRQPEALGQEHGEKPSVTIRFSVQDSGIGIVADELEKIFKPFQQADRSNRAIQGTGLGLAISQRLAHMMGSKIEVESCLGKGSHFWFDVTLPTGERPVPEAKDTVVTHIHLTGWRPKVLVVEDDVNSRSLLLNWLTHTGFQVAEADDGQKGVEKALAWQPDLVLLDIQLPVLDGLSVARRIQQDPALGKTVIFAVSANAFGEDKLQSTAAGCAEFIPKPVDLFALWQTILKHFSLEWNSLVAETKKATARSLLDEVPPLPQEQVIALRRHLERGDIRGIKAEITALANLAEFYQPLVAELEQLISQFRLKQIGQLLDKLSK